LTREFLVNFAIFFNFREMNRNLLLASVCLAAATAVGYSLYTQRTSTCKKKTDTLSKKERKEEKHTKVDPQLQEKTEQKEYLQ
jgi:hypothetical protein